MLLVIAAVLALIAANLPISDWYSALLNIPVAVKFGLFEINKPLLLWVNDGLMALFFFLVGLEIKREVLGGQLSDIRQLVLPLVAAVAGIVVPALIYVGLNHNSSVALSGWAVPSATDIAFALGIFVIFGKHLPLSLKLFLLSVAIFDDIAAVVIIALFYSQDLSTISIVVAMGGLSILALLNYFNVQSKAPYILIGLVVWAAVLKSGVHATLAGFAVALFIPANKTASNKDSMLEQIEHGLHPWVTYMILPLFAFVNAGVGLSEASMTTLLNSITMGIAAGLFIGKQVGIWGACWLAVKLKIAKMPENSTWAQIYGVSLLCGVGFTMSLFIGTLAFEGADPHYLESVKIGVLLGSLLSAVVGALVISRSQVKVSNSVGRAERNPLLLNDLKT
ncbi:Na+/H+ antiporter NhaA [Pleionea sp. CnH1-48]|nr:Na+/H+ antiporter NhaA [Pleionea sp. CnH1-48]